MFPTLLCPYTPSTSVSSDRALVGGPVVSAETVGVLPPEAAGVGEGVGEGVSMRSGLVASVSSSVLVSVVRVVVANVGG